jgi:hypothetical protein
MQRPFASLGLAPFLMFLQETVMHRITILFLVLFGTSFIQGCTVGKQASEIRQFSRCDFRLNSISNIRLAGVVMDDKSGYSDMTMPEMAQVTAALLSGKLLLTFDANLQARNPNDKLAAINRMEYIILVDGSEITRGELDRRIEIQPDGGIASFPVNVQLDVLKALSDKSGKAVTNLALNLSGSGGEPSRVSLKLKPTVMIGSGYIEYPGYITVRKEFSSR